MVSISSGSTANTNLNAYLAAWTTGTFCNGTILFTVPGAIFTLTGYSYTVRSRITLDASSLASKVTLLAMRSWGHFKVQSFGNLTAFNVNFNGVYKSGFANTVGGSIYMTSGYARFVSCGFVNNTILNSVNAGGAGIYQTGGTLTLDSCIFDSNSIYSTTTSGGAALQVRATTGYPSPSVTITRCTFQRNVLNTSSVLSTYAGGGAVLYWIQSLSGARAFTISSTTFYENTVILTGTTLSSGGAQGGAFTFWGNSNNQQVRVIGNDVVLRPFTGPMH